MNDPDSVRRVDPSESGQEQIDQVTGVGESALHASGERFPFEQFHHEEK